MRNSFISWPSLFVGWLTVAAPSLRAQCPDGSPPPCVRAPSSRPTLSSDLIAIAPFDVLAPGLALWREGLVDVLSRRIDGAGPLRTVSPSIVMRRWRGRSDPASATNIGLSTGAGLVVFGQLVGGTDSVRLSATLLDVAQSRAVAEFEWRGTSLSVDRMADSLVLALLREVGRTRPLGAVRGMTLGTQSLPALRAFLQGEQFLRRSQLDTALMFYRRALTIDSTFVLALSHAAMAAGWQHGPSDSSHRVYALAAGRLNRGLGPRDSLLVQADSLSALFYSGPTHFGGRWWTVGKQFMSTLDEAARRYPEDPHVLYSLGDARYHAGFVSGIGNEASLEAFDRAIALDSSFSPAYLHAIGLALQLRGPAAGRRYAQAFLRAGALGRYSEAVRLFNRLLDSDADIAQQQRLVNSVAADLPFLINGAFDRWPDTGETAVRLARSADAYQLRYALGSTDAIAARLRLASTLAFRGHFRDAYAKAGIEFPILYLDMVAVGGLVSDSTDVVVRRLATGVPYPALLAIPWFASGRDTAWLRDAERRFAFMLEQLPASAPPDALEPMGYLIESVRAYLLLANGDSAVALERFIALPDSACFGACSWNELVRVRLLESQGRVRESLAWLDRHRESNSIALPSDVLWVLTRARIKEMLGDRAAAATAYEYVVAAWANADPELRPYVVQARAGLARLGPVRRP